MLKNIGKKVAKFLISLYQILKWRLTSETNKVGKTAFVFKCSKWKQEVLSNYFPHHHLKFVPFDSKIWMLKYYIEKFENPEFIVWGFQEEDNITKYASENNIQIYRVEDGFIRSADLGSNHALPFSLCIDKTGLYFDSTKHNDLETLLNTYDFNNPKLLEESKKCIGMLKKLRVSKYNHIQSKDIKLVYGKKVKKRILVIGQVEDDASIIKGCSRKLNNNDLVRIAKKENPDAEIIYKPHPDVLAGNRTYHSDPTDIEDIAKVIKEPLNLVDALETIDRVYTITSLSGFEALLRGIPVTTIGAPFYSGWGLTDDRQIVTRRKRKLTIEELFAGAYILYPTYINPYTKENFSLRKTIITLAKKHI
ncbi:capsular polysaccharide biosynthesis protein [Sutcliffiella horikoshii]|uniref:capsular polysaccharide export protein, LipB/KpsS family n=1 Tax=Sutcliffiella horikoshii TaxID=79883 RepID=UPI003CF5BD1C